MPCGDINKPIGVSSFITKDIPLSVQSQLPSVEEIELREIEKSKIACARKFFAKITSEQVKYEVVDSYGKLMELVK